MPKVSQLPVDSSPATSDYVVGDQGVSSTVKFRFIDLITLFFNNIPANIIKASNIDLTTLPAAQQSWQTPTLLNSWVNYNALFNTAQFMKDSEGFVHLKGMVSSGTNGSAVYVLPAGYRPIKVCYFIGPNSSGTGIVNIDPNGTVKFDSGANGYQSMDGMTFKAEL